MNYYCFIFLSAFCRNMIMLFKSSISEEWESVFYSFVCSIFVYVSVSVCQFELKLFSRAVINVWC